MNKVELTAYLADLLTIDAYTDDIGMPTPDWLNWEEAQLLAELEKLITKEKAEHEARTSKPRLIEGPKARTEPTSGFSDGGRADRISNGNGSVNGDVIQRKGLQGPNRRV